MTVRAKATDAWATAQEMGSFYGALYEERFRKEFPRRLWPILVQWVYYRHGQAEYNDNKSSLGELSEEEVFEAFSEGFMEVVQGESK